MHITNKIDNILNISLVMSYVKWNYCFYHTKHAWISSIEMAEVMVEIWIWIVTLQILNMLKISQFSEHLQFFC